MRYGLTEEMIEQIQQVLSSFDEVERVILYGSRAKGCFKPASDIDLTIEGSHLDLSLLNKIDWQLDDLLLPYIFDLSIKEHITDHELLDHIDRVGIIFFER